MKCVQTCVATLAGIVALAAMVPSVIATGDAQAATAPTASMEDALVLYQDGRYGRAAEEALALGEAEADALAARALLAQARVSPRNDRAALVSEAKSAAQSAIARDPEVVEGHLQLAVALGFQGRAMGDYFAHQQGLATQAREAIDAALALDPDDPWALALSGTWHLEITKGAGPLLASALYDASLSSGITDIRKAIAIPGASLIVLHQCALQLLAHDADAFGAEAERTLVAAGNARPHGAFERRTARQADQLLRAFRSGNASMLKREIDREQMSY